MLPKRRKIGKRNESGKWRNNIINLAANKTP